MLHYQIKFVKNCLKILEQAKKNEIDRFLWPCQAARPTNKLDRPAIGSRVVLSFRRLLSSAYLYRWQQKVKPLLAFSLSYNLPACSLSPAYSRHRCLYKAEIFNHRSGSEAIRCGTGSAQRYHSRAHRRSL